mmetsp:Transcript_193/g.599  ORF Transcript_193/g.599 Transcript_193/m.599 type:complete len:253 (-) Transcript_193:450-1208(-)
MVPSTKTQLFSHPMSTATLEFVSRDCRFTSTPTTSMKIWFFFFCASFFSLFSSSTFFKCARVRCAYAPKVRYALPHPRSTSRTGRVSVGQFNSLLPELTASLTANSTSFTNSSTCLYLSRRLAFMDFPSFEETPTAIRNGSSGDSNRGFSRSWSVMLLPSPPGVTRVVFLPPGPFAFDNKAFVSCTCAKSFLRTLIWTTVSNVSTRQFPKPSPNASLVTSAALKLFLPEPSEDRPRFVFRPFALPLSVASIS